MGAPVAIDAPADPIPAGAKDRRLAAVVHLGPLVCGLNLPLFLWVVDDTKTPFCRSHVRHAIRFQLRFLVVVAAYVGLFVATEANPHVWLAYLLTTAVVFGLEIPNVVRALGGKPPSRLSQRSWRRDDGARGVPDEAVPGPGGR